MHARTLSAVLVCLTTASPLLASPLSATTPSDARIDAAAPIERFMQVAPKLFRGAQPDKRGFAYLKTLGVQTVVSLKEDADERKLVESLGMAFVHIPVTFHPFGGDMSKEAVEKFLAVVDDPSRGAVFVHCKRGADRTGAFVGVYRIVRQGWDVERAYNEARNIGMRWWYTAVKDELADFARQLKVAAPAPAPAS